MAKTLRSYQAEAVQAFLKSDGHSTLSMATGSGKTVVACAIMKELASREYQANHPLKPPYTEPPQFRAIILVPSCALMDQWEKVLKTEGIKDATIVTYQWAAQHSEDEAFWSKYTIIVADEEHHLGFGPVYKRLLVPIYKAKYALGLTATPPKPVDGVENVSLQVLPVVFVYSIADAQRDGFAPEFKVRPVEVQLSEDERRRYTELTDKIKEMIARYGENYQNRPYSVDVNPLTGEKYTVWGAQLTTERRKLVALAEQKYVEMDRIVREVLANPENRRVFVWSSFVDALVLAKAVLNRGGQVAELVTGETPKKERRRIIEEAWGRDFPVLLVANVGSEGLDAPEAAVGIVLAGAKTTRETVQRLGRLLRKNPSMPDKVATIYLVFASRTTDEKLVFLFDTVNE